MMSDRESVDCKHLNAIQRRVRLVLLLDASRQAGIEPLPTLRLHFIAYLANVLSPVWEMLHTNDFSLKKSGSILKRRSGPFYPDLQRDLDRLVGMGIAKVSNLRYESIDGVRFRLEGQYKLNSGLATPILTYVYSLPDEAATAKYLRELVLALSALSDREIDSAASQDATYSDPTIGLDNVIDFGEWSHQNYSARAAQRAGELVYSGAAVGASEKVHLYIRHLRRRLKGGR